MKILLDSNIIIYAVSGNNDKLISYLRNEELYCSLISYVEVLGYHKLNKEDRLNFENFFDEITLLSISFDVIKRAAKIRQNRPVSLGDSIISATAIENNLTLITRNVPDFKNIEKLKIENPFSTF